MGSCVSVHKDPESAMKLSLAFGSKTDKLLIPSPVNDDSPVADGAVKSQWSTSPSVTVSPDFGNKEENFFDSHPWLESDCEDDFHSVNGDFTPSRGSTPVHHNFSVGTLANRNPFAGRTSNSTPEPSPTDKKKRLSELFKESELGDQDLQGQNSVSNTNGASAKSESKTATLEVPPKSTNGTPYMSGANSVCSSERSPNGVLKQPGEKSMKLVQCCLPRLRTSRSFTERKKGTSPAPIMGR